MLYVGPLHWSPSRTQAGFLFPSLLPAGTNGLPELALFLPQTVKFVATAETKLGQGALGLFWAVPMPKLEPLWIIWCQERDFSTVSQCYGPYQ